MSEFAGAVFTEQFQIEILTPIFPFNVNLHETDMLLQATRAFSACKLAASELKTYYAQLSTDQSTANSFGNYTSSYPYKINYSRSDGGTIKFEYIERMHSQNLLFLAETSTICMKLTRRYSADAHKHCANQGVVPELYVVELSPGGWYMVVMECFDKEYFDDIREWPQDPCTRPKSEMDNAPT